jgi:predicted TIM-barrel fold metal-dependent hydrolase
MIIDSNMHWLPENLFDDKDLLECFLSAVPKQYGVHARVCPIPGKNLRQIVIEQPQGCEVLNYAENQYCCEEQIKDMNEAGIDIGMLRIPCWQEWLDLETCKKLNNGLAGHLKAHPGRFLALAVVPPWGTKDSLKEMERCIKELGFSGVQMAAHYGDLYLDEEEFRPHFKKISEMNIPVVVHHTPLPVDFKSLCKYTNLRRQYGRCVAQGTAVGRELFSDMFEEFPNLKMIHSMLGGGFFAYSNMLAPKITGKDAVERFQTEAGKINKYLENNIYYDVSGAIQWGRTQLECAVKVLGADHILYGSSYPIRRDWFSQGVEFVKNLDIDDKSKSLILSKNAIRLFNIK